jgi:hypothetical protein
MIMAEIAMVLITTLKGWWKLQTNCMCVYWTQGSGPKFTLLSSESHVLLFVSRFCGPLMIINDGYNDEPVSYTRRMQIMVLLREQI